MSAAMRLRPRTQQDLSDEAAFERALGSARAGEAPGFEWLWHRFSRQVAAFARLQGSDDPDGIANDTFAAAFGRIETFSGTPTNFVSFVFAIARNKISDEHRKRRRRVITAALDSAGLDRARLEAASAATSAETDALAGLSIETAEALRRLTDEQREIVFLRLVADLPIDEVAALTGRSVGAVKAMQHRALTAMRKEISRGAVSP